MTTIADVKARVKALTGPGTTHISSRINIYHGPPIPDTSDLSAYSLDGLKLAIDAPAEVLHGASSASSSLVGLFAQCRALEEKVERMQAAIRIRDATTCGESSSSAEATFRAKGIAAEAEIERLRPVLDATELETSLRKAESRAERAERRAQELEAQLAEARRSARQPLASDDTNSAPPGQARAPALPAAEKVATKKGATPKAPSGHREGVTDTDGKNGCGALLQQIRLERAADVDVPAHLSGAVEALKAQLHRSLQLLAEDLYRDDVHCISELLQNADDNSYADGVEPTWRLCHGGTVVWTANNEVGMSHADVRAICDTNNSSKRTESGRIGRKGVGMKSVFKISSQPHVLSAGFAFKFDLELNGLLGYVLPEPLGSETVASLPASVRTLWAEQKQTIFYLPLRASAPDATALRNALCEQLHSLLFLRRLRCLQWINESKGDGLTLRRRRAEALTIAQHPPQSEAVESWCVDVEELSISSDADSTPSGPNGVQLFLRCAARIKVPPRLQAECRGAESTEIIIGLPLSMTASTKSPSSSKLTRHADGGGCGGVFCFLPVRNVGLRFLLHGDFSLTSSRGTYLSSV